MEFLCNSAVRCFVPPEQYPKSGPVFQDCGVILEGKDPYYHISSAIRQIFSLPKNPKDLDPSRPLALFRKGKLV